MKKVQLVFAIFTAIAGTAGPRDVWVREMHMHIGKEPHEFRSDRHMAMNRIYFRFRTIYESDSSLLERSDLWVHPAMCHIQAKHRI